MATDKVHIMRIAVLDLLGSRVRQRSIRTGDPSLRLVYYEMLFLLHDAGGVLPNDPVYLEDLIGIPSAEIQAAVEQLLEIGKTGRGGLQLVDGKLANQRIVEDLQGELEFRETQAQRGREGGLARASARLASARQALSERQADAERVLSPPSPSPSPAPLPSTTTSASQPSSVPHRTSPGAAPAAVLVYPTRGKDSEWPLTHGQVAEWEELYPGLDVLAECRKAAAYVRSDPSKRKTAQGMPRFLVNWLNRSIDSRRPGPPSPARASPSGGGERRHGLVSPPTSDERRRKLAALGKPQGSAA